MDLGIADLRLDFVSTALPKDTFSVVSFEGSEGLSQLYAVTVDLVSSQKDPDLDAVMGAGARFVISRRQGDVFFHGILESFSEDAETDGRYYYRALLRPRLWRLTQEIRNQVFIDQTIQAVLQKVLTDGGLPGSAFAFRLQGSYPERDFICQYGETCYDFLLRWMGRYGLYYFFEQNASGETLVITDTKIAHTDAPGAGRLVYAQTSGLGASHSQETVHDFGVRRTLTTGKVTLRDYNYRKPALDLTVEQPLAVKGSGESYTWGDHYRTPDEGKKLVERRTEALAAGCRQMFGASFVPDLRPGFTFDLTRHFNPSLNGKYLAVSVTHKGYAAMAGSAGSGPAVAGERRPHYENAFTAIPAGTQYRPPQNPRAPLTGLMHAHIDAAGSGTYAELDDQGRYKIRLPFDQSGQADGKASAPVRMLQPHVGAGFGLHCPLHKGAEVALGYMDGNPDRPIILGAAPNPENQSPVTSDNQTQCRLTTAGGHKLHIEDKEGSQRILLQSSTGDFLRIGTHNDPVPASDSFKDTVEEYFSKEGIAIYAPDNHWLEITSQNELLIVFGEYMLNILGWFNEMLLEYLQFNMNIKFTFNLAGSIEYETFGKIYEAIHRRLHPEKNILQGTAQTMTADDIRIAERTTHTALSHTRAFGNHESAARNAKVAAASQEQAAETSNEAYLDKKELAATKTAASQQTMQTSATKQQEAGQKVLMTERDIASCVSSTEEAVNKTAATQKRINTATNKVNTAVNELNFFGIYSKN